MILKQTILGKNHFVHLRSRERPQIYTCALQSFSIHVGLLVGVAYSGKCDEAPGLSSQIMGNQKGLSGHNSFL